MEFFTAKEIADLLIEDGDEEMSLRKVRYYTQIEILSPLEMVNGKGKYTSKHLEELRAIRTMQKTGERLGAIKGKIQGLGLNDLSRIGNQYSYYTSARLLETRSVQATKDVGLTLSDQVSIETEKKMIKAIMAIIESN